MFLLVLLLYVTLLCVPLSPSPSLPCSLPVSLRAGGAASVYPCSLYVMEWRGGGCCFSSITHVCFFSDHHAPACLLPDLYCLPPAYLGSI